MEIVVVVVVVVGVWSMLIVHSVWVYAGNHNEARALLDFKKSLVDPQNNLSNWILTSQYVPCDWFRIDCDYQNSVGAIYLGGVGIEGKIDGVALNKLPNLVHLDLSQNKITGSIPTELGHIKFSRLILNDNSINGAIPCSLGSSHIKYLILLNDNKLEGCIPPLLFNVETHNFSNNHLDGTNCSCPNIP